MKKSITSIVLGCIFFTAMEKSFAQGIYQLPNGNFESGWYRETSNAGSIVPDGFHSFYSATGSMASLGAAQRCDSSRDVRVGAIGVFSLRLYSNSVLGVRANGNVTSGRINAGSMTANNQDNYNYTDVPNSFYQEITGTPDSLRFWVKYLPGRSGATNLTDMGRIRVYIHGTDPCRDAPAYPAGMIETQLYYGKAMKNFYKENGGWNCYTVPFEYVGANMQRNIDGNYYVLVSMTTNSTPGGGANNADEVYFDDIEFIYGAYLSDLKVNGTTIPGFEKSLLTYGGPKLVGTPGSFAFPYNSSNITYTTESDSSRSVVITNVNGPGGDADGGYTSIVVTAEDYISTKEYRIYYSANLSDTNTIDTLVYTMNGVDTIHVPNFSPSTLNYPILLTDPEEVRIPRIVDTCIVLSDTNAEIYRIVQPTGVNSVGSVTVRAQNYSLKVYTVSFSKVISTDSKLNWIKIGGTNIANFDADTLVYDTVFTTCATAIPAITYEKSSAWANVSYTPASMNNRTAKIVVTAENGDSTVYIVNFILENNNASVTQFRYGTSATNQITTQAGVFVYESAYSFTAAPSALTPTLGCGAATYTRTPTNNVFYPDTNYFTITAQDGITTETYKIVIKNTNCFLATGNNSGLRYNYNGLVNQNSAINISSTNNGNLNPVITSAIVLPAGPDVPAQLVVYGLAAAATAAPPTYQIIQPTSRTDTAEVILTANDGVTQKIYQVPFRPTLSTDASLSNITWNGNNIQGFTSNNTYYLIAVDANVTTVPTIVGTPTFQWLPAGNIVVTPAADLFGTTTIVVTAENGTTTRTYYVEFTVQSADNAYLSVLKYDNIVVPNFRPTTLTYSVDIPYSTVTPPVLSATSMSANASVFYSQPTTTPSQGKVLVISENMAGMKIYTVNFNLVKSIDSTLSDIKVNGVSLQNFDPQVFLYNEVLPYTELNAPVVSVTPNYASASVNITQINTVTGTATIAVTAEDTNHKATYTINFTRELSPIIDLDTVKYTYNGQNYACDASSSGTTITIILPVETEGIPNITGIVLADNRSGFVINAQPSLINNLTGTVTVTAEDLTTEIYEVVFQRTLSSSTLLTGITYNGISVPNFNPDTLNYTVILPFNAVSSLVVSATLDWKHTDTLIAQTNVPWLTPLSASIRVTSEDGQNSKIYTITFIQQGSPNLANLSYKLGGITPSPNIPFDPFTLKYNVILPMSTTDIPVLEYTPLDSRVIPHTTQNTLSEPNGTIQLTIITTDGIPDTLIYTVNFTVSLSTEALLSDLQVDGVTIEDFQSNRLSYSMAVDYEYGASQFPVITAEATQPDARIDITEITEYPGTAIIKVYAGDTTISRTYTIAFSMESGNNNYLSEILVDDESLWYFNKNVFLYEVKLPYGTTQLPVVSAIAEDERAIITIIPASQIGDTTDIYVSALNGDEAHYRVFFVVRKNPNALAKSISIDWEPLENFNPTTRNYTYNLPADYSGTPFVAVELQNPNATYTIIPPTTIPAQMQIIVTAEDTDSTFSYRITFEKNVSIVSYDNQAEIKVYPNPTDGKLRISTSDTRLSDIQIYDVVGKLQTLDNRISDIGQSEIEIDISHLSAGIYFLKINDSKLIKVVKN